MDEKIENERVYYPVIIPTLCRSEHFMQCIESLKKNRFADNTELIIGLDFPPADKYKNGYEEIKKYIPTITGFRKITVFAHEKNLGSVGNTDFLVKYALSKYDAYIFSEDDNIFSPFFLDFMNKGLEKYKYDDTVMAICGYSYPINWESEKDCILQYQYFSAWGCGFWKEKDAYITNRLSGQFVRSEFLKKGSLIKWGKVPWNLKTSIALIFADKIRLFDITRSFYMYATESCVLMPTKTLVSNIGWDGSGENCANESSIDFKNLERNDTITVDLDSCEKIFSIKLEKFLKKLIIEKDTSFLVLLIFKIFGYKNFIRLNNFRKRILKKK